MLLSGVSTGPLLTLLARTDICWGDQHTTLEGLPDSQLPGFIQFRHHPIALKSAFAINLQSASFVKFQNGPICLLWNPAFTLWQVSCLQMKPDNMVLESSADAYY